MWAQVDFAWRLGALCVAFVAGIAAQLQVRELLSPSASAAVAVASLVSWAAGSRTTRWRKGVLQVVAIALAGHALATWQAQARLTDALPPGLEGEDLVIDGVVAGLPQHGGSGLRFRFDIASAQWRGAPVAVPRRVVLGWYADFGGDPLDAGPAGGLQAGQVWRLTVRLRQPHANRNPHGNDQELAYFEQGVRAIGSVREKARIAPHRLGTSWAHPVERLRQHVRDAIFATVPDRRAAGVLAALALGDQSAIVVAVNKPIFSLPREATPTKHRPDKQSLRTDQFTVDGRDIKGVFNRSDRKQG